MINEEFKINAVRRQLYDRDSLYILGCYYNGAENRSNVRILLDEKQIYPAADTKGQYTLSSVNSTAAGITAKFSIKVKLPELAGYNKFRILAETENEICEAVNIDINELKAMLDRIDFNIDSVKKSNSKICISGWIMYNDTYSIELSNKAGNKFSGELKELERNDVYEIYPELKDYNRKYGFAMEADINTQRHIIVTVKADGREEKVCLDTKYDISDAAGIGVRLHNSIIRRGKKATAKLIVKRAANPKYVAKTFGNEIKKIKPVKAMISAVRKKKSDMRKERQAKEKFSEIKLLCNTAEDIRRKYKNGVRRILVLPDAEKIFTGIEKGYIGKNKYSILVPLYNTPRQFLKEMIESVQMQTYSNWELCLADGSDDKHSYVGELCKRYCSRDKRILYKKLDKNYGISGNTNECIKMAAGNYIALFDHDDFLHPMALYEVDKVIEEQGADYVYTDEATFQVELDNVVTYHFKPDFAPDNLRANNYICHFSVFSKELLDKAGWYNSEYDGSQDHDLILRLTENANSIRHISEILYFWRSHPGSVAEDINSKTYAIDAGKRAVLAHIKRIGMDGTVESSKAFPTIYNVKYKLYGEPKVSIIIPNYNHKEDLERCINSILRLSTYKNYEIIVAENNSTEQEVFDYYDELNRTKNIKVIIWDKPFNYSAINNFAVGYASGEQLLFLNNDIEVITPEWIEELLMYAQRSDVAAVGAKLYYPDDTIQHAGIILGMGAHRVAGHGHYGCDKNNLGYMGRLCYAQNVSAVTAACMMMRKSVFEQIGGFDEEFTVAYNDVDLCVKALDKGYLNIFTPGAEMYHYESTTRGMEDTDEKQKRFNEEIQRFKNKWHSLLQQGDPYFNKNFSLDSSFFEIKEDSIYKG